MNKTLKLIRKKILTTSALKKAGHIASSFSVVEIRYFLHKSATKDDRVILSKGHASLALYAVLNSLKKISDEELMSFCDFDSNLGGHPDRSKLPVAVASTGSLGHGLPIAVGIALAKKTNHQAGKVYCVIGDGEANEGTIWESALLASHLKLNNLVCVIDDNESQTRSVTSSFLIEKFKSFGWQTIFIKDGNCLEEIENSFQSLSSQNTPICFVAKTKKGFGVIEMQKDMFTWHHKSPNLEELNLFMEELS